MLSDNLLYRWWKNIDKTIFILIIFLFSLGLFFSLVSTSLVASDKLDTNNYFFFFRHLAYIFIGMIVLIFFSSLRRKSLFKLSIYFFFISLFFLFANCDQTSQSKNNSNGIIVVKVFSSLTCPHCADLHGTIYEKLKNEYIGIGKVKFEHNAFPLDLAALNAEKILQCTTDTKIKMSFLTELYKKQNKWAAGSDIRVINESIKKIGEGFNLTQDQMNKCLGDKKLEKKILNERIESQKNYKVKSTPTIYLNQKKYEGKRDYNSFKKAIDKLL